MFEPPGFEPLGLEPPTFEPWATLPGTDPDRHPDPDETILALSLGPDPSLTILTLS